VLCEGPQRDAAAVSGDSQVPAEPVRQHAQAAGPVPPRSAAPDVARAAGAAASAGADVGVLVGGAGAGVSELGARPPPLSTSWSKL